MTSSYSIIDQAADLGIHRIHSLVLGDTRKEARTAARFSPPQHKRPALGRGDARYEEQQHEWETKKELERIARRHNLKMYASPLSQMEPFPIFLLEINLFDAFVIML
jgi:hypothetical protein